VALLLYIANIMIHWMWLRRMDPDNSAIPYLTALGDLLGISLLAMAFGVLYSLGDNDGYITE
jgi:solute carrier family 41